MCTHINQTSMEAKFETWVGVDDSQLNIQCRKKNSDYSFNKIFEEVQTEETFKSIGKISAIRLPTYDEMKELIRRKKGPLFNKKDEWTPF